MQLITGLLIIKNEAPYIERALRSLLWCDEIIVVDAFSTDGTSEICQDPSKPWAHKIRFFQQKWLGFSCQRNFALSKSKYPWIFFLDGDEECSLELAEKIKSLLSDDQLSPAQYKIRRQEFFIEKPIHYGIWNPSYHIRFFYKAGFEVIGDVHEGPKSAHETRTLEQAIIHVRDLRIERFLAKLNHYTTLQAQADFDRGVRTNLFRILMSFPAMFYKNFIYYKAYKDGREGVIISILEGISRTVRHLKIWQIEQTKDTQSSFNNFK
jgi:glycosyltransferase involved in cell wall biosynthesis